jgi:hypothetical protein
MTFNLKADGAHLTALWRGRGEEPPSLEGDSVNFKVKREFQGRSMVMNYEGTVAGNEIRFKQAATRRSASKERQNALAEEPTAFVGGAQFLALRDGEPAMTRN